MKYPHPRVLTPNQVEIGQSCILGALPAGIAFKHDRKEYRTVTYPRFTQTARNAQHTAQVWRKALRKLEKLSYREEVRVIGKG